MNWKNVLFLVRVDRKSGRLLRGVKKTRYKESGIRAYWPYWLAAIIGALGGYLASVSVSFVYSSPFENPNLPPLDTSALSFFASMPTFVLIFSTVLTMLQQIQLSGIKATTQVMYWLPVTWQEHTLASILANLLGIPLAIVSGFASGILVFSAFNGLILPALLTVLVMLGAAFMGSSITEILRVLQVRISGAIYRSSGRAAVWVRLIGSLAFFIIFYVVYLSVVYGFTNFIQGLTTFQNTLWFVPFVWLGLTLYYLFSGVLLEGIIFIALSAVFIVALYYLAILLNQRFGLYEPPAIRVQTSGVYSPKTGFLGKFGFSSVEAAIIRKDIRAFTRRRELISIFIVPVIFLLIPLMQSVGITNGSAPGQLRLFYAGMTFLFPVSIMAMSVGSILIGEEGQAVWRIYASPISPKNLVRAKLFFISSLSIITLLLTGSIGILFYQPLLQFIIVGYVEGLFLAFALGSISLSIGFKGADFSQTRRARMIRQEWSIIALLVCGLAALAVLAPLIPFAFSLFISSFMAAAPVDSFYLAVSVVISGIIASVITAVFYRVNLNSAKELIRKAEV